MTFTKSMVVFGIAMMAAGPALATTIANQDSKEHVLTVDRGAQETDHTIAAGNSLKVDCPERCGFRLKALGYGRQAGNDGQLVIDKKGMLQFANELNDSGTRSN